MRCVDYGKQQSGGEHAVIGVMVVKGPFGSVKQHTESSKIPVGGSVDCTASQQELPLRLKPF